jgi:hypothetical protein
MAGRVHRLIQQLYEVRGAGPSSLHFLRAHLVLSGINPDEYTEATRDDEQKVVLLEKMLADFQRLPGVSAANQRSKDKDIP